MAVQQHPPEYALLAFALGRSSEVEAASIEAHIGECSTCLMLVESATDDDFVKFVRDTTPQAKPRNESQATTRTEYRNLRFFAKGGLGEVSLARDEVVGREIAVKRMLPDASHYPARRKRFLREARITGRLEHPGIVPVYGIGEDQSGEPCFTMRFVPGETLRDAIRALHANGIVSPNAYRPLLNRFVSLCSTVAFAHSRGVIHRDIKPSNIAVGSYGETILLDWGLAQADDEPEPTFEADEQVHSPQSHYRTETGVVLGTPGFMAPEQAQGQRVGPAADIYSLGVTLLTLLTGRGPAEQVDTTTAPAALMAIARKAMAQHPDQRYATAQELAQDLENWLADEPVTAYREPLMERTRRFIRHHYTATVVTLALLFLTTIGLSAGTYLLNREQGKTAKARDENARLAASETNLREQEQLALIEVRFANDTIFDVFNELDLRKVRQGVDPLEYVLAERLIAASQRLTPETIRDPATRVRLQQRLGLTLLSLDRPKEAIPVFASARATIMDTQGKDHPDIIDNSTYLAEAYREAGEANQAMPLYIDAKSLAQATYGEDDSRTIKCISNVASGYKAMGQIQKALPLFEQVYNWRKAKLGEDDPDTLLSSNNLAASFSSAGQRDLAVKHYERTLLLRQQKLGRDHPDSLMSLNNLASALLDVGQLDKALPLLEEAVELHRAKLGSTHRQTLMTMGNLAFGYRRKGRLTEAISLYERTINLRKVKLGPDHPDTLLGQNNLAFAYQEVNQYNKAIQLFEETLDVQKSKFTLQHPDTLLTMNNLAYAYHTVDKLPEAIKLYESALQVQRQTLGAQHPQTMGTVGNLAVAYVDAREGAKAAPLFEEFVAFKRKAPNLTEMNLANTLTQVGNYLLTCEQYSAAEKYLRESLAIRMRLAADKWATFNTQAILGRVLSEQNKLTEAERQLSQGYEGLLLRRKSIPASSVNSVFQAGQWLIDLYTKMNQSQRIQSVRATLPLEAAPGPRAISSK